MSPEPYVRDDGLGGVQIVICRVGRESECHAVSPAAGLAMIEKLAGWLASRQRACASVFPSSVMDASACLPPPSSRP